MRDDSERIMKESVELATGVSRGPPPGRDRNRTVFPCPDHPPARACSRASGRAAGPGVAATARPDAQAKGLGEYLRSRTVLVPEQLAGQIG